ncbi:sulfatase family protein [Allorhodopirellula solitaria]|uniref:Arylsulfatase n=1 Tax=Allorhodopirellula solitaria TaxID=2527987 RepID=A0A5C5WGZ8_9BACT|nr:sulfatase [Allorhodopirellula solitaria]TWT50056.1 Arylsulfatase [Allorhodopirellula solitaria]
MVVLFVRRIALLLLCLSSVFSLASVSWAGGPLNVVIIQTDEHNFRTLGCYRDTLSDEQAMPWGRNAIVETPAIDSIANRGAICTSFYASSPVCTPSRAAFFSGRMPQQTGASSNNKPYASDVVTFAEVLRQAGYATGYAGKWHLDGPGKPQWSPRRQFGFTDNRFMFNRGHWKHLELVDDQPRVASRNPQDQPTYNLADADETTFTTDWLTDRAIDFITEHRSGPFCYHLSIPDPHGPNTVRAPYDDMYGDRAIRPPSTFSTNVEQPKWIASGRNADSLQFRPDLMVKYFGMVKCIDDNVARILETLQEHDLLNQTIVVFTSDHGDLCFEHGRLNKGNPYEGSAKIPMIIAAPEIIPAGTRVDEALATVDFMPTLLSLMQQPIPATVVGRDASVLLTGKEDANWEDLAIIQAAGDQPAWFAVISDRYKLVLSVADHPWLFDLEEDPDELSNQWDPNTTARQQDDSVRKVADRFTAALQRYVDQQPEGFTHRKISDQIERLLRSR